MGSHSELAAVIVSGAIWDPIASRQKLERTFFNKRVYSRELSKSMAEMIIR